MAESASDLSLLIKFDELLLEVDRLFKGEHRGLAAGDHDGVEFINVDVRGLLGVGDEFSEFRRCDETHTDEVVRGIARGVARIGHAVRLAFAAVGAEDFNLVSGFGEHEIRMREFAPPEADRPLRGRGNGGIGYHDSDPLGVGLAKNVRVFETHSFSPSLASSSTISARPSVYCRKHT